MVVDHDIIVIGGGPAGLTAGLYAGRSGLKTLLIERGVIGGLIINAERVENYPGFPEGISGVDLTSGMAEQAMKYGVITLMAEVTGIELVGDKKFVGTSEGDYVARAVIITSGSDNRRLGIPGEEEFTGRGVSYCANCDGAFFRDQRVAVIGGGDSAIEEALFLTRFASKVAVIHRRDQLRASKVLQDRAFSNPKIELMWDTVPEEIIGESAVKCLKLRNVKSGERSTLDVQGVFIYVGQKPNTDYLKGLLHLDEAGQVIVSQRMETNIPGIFAAGDIRQNAARQVISAAGDGATAAISANKYLSEH